MANECEKWRYWKSFVSFYLSPFTDHKRCIFALQLLWVGWSIVQRWLLSFESSHSWFWCFRFFTVLWASEDVHVPDEKRLIGLLNFLNGVCYSKESSLFSVVQLVIEVVVCDDMLSSFWLFVVPILYACLNPTHSAKYCKSGLFCGLKFKYFRVFCWIVILFIAIWLS